MARQGRGIKLLDKIVEKDIDGIKQILKYDVDLTVDRKGDTPIHLASRKGYLDIIQLLVDHGCDVNQKNQNGFAALHYAARDGRMDIVEFLLKCGADPNIMNADGDAPIHELVKFQPMDVIEQMVTLGMDVNLKNKLGRTPLHMAAANNRQEAIETLLTCGAKSDMKDKHGHTAAEICKNPQLIEAMKLHSLNMEAKKKGVIHAQGISITRKNSKERIHLKRVGVTIETVSFATDLTASFYLRREKSENSSFTFSSDKGDDMLSDVFIIKIANVPRASGVTLTVPIYGLPTAQEDLFVRFDTGTKQTVLDARSTEEGKSCTFAITLTPDCFVVCALFTCAKTEVTLVGQEGAVVTTDADTEMKLEIPPDTFSEETNVSIQVFPTEIDAEQTTEDVLTDVYILNSDHSITNKKMKLTVPLHQKVDNVENVALVTADDINDDADESCLSLIETVPRLGNKVLIYDIPHFSIHVAVDRKQFEKNKKDIYDRLIRTTERQRSAVFFVVLHYEENMRPIMVVECSMAEKAAKRIQKWVTKGYKIQSPEQSGIFMLSPFQEFSVSFQGVLPEEDNGTRKLAFLPRRASFQPFKLPTDVNDNSCKEGSVVIRKTCSGQEDKETNIDNIVTVLPFIIKPNEKKPAVPTDDEEAQRPEDENDALLKPGYGEQKNKDQEDNDEARRPEDENEAVPKPRDREQKNKDQEDNEEARRPDDENKALLKPGYSEQKNKDQEELQKGKPWLFPSYMKK